MLKLALALVLASTTLACAESLGGGGSGSGGRDVMNPPTVTMPAIAGDPAPVVRQERYEPQTTVVREREPSAFYTHEREPVDCWQCRR